MRKFAFAARGCAAGFVALFLIDAAAAQDRPRAGAAPSGAIRNMAEPDRAVATTDADRELTIIGPRYIRAFHLRDYRDWVKEESDWVRDDGASHMFDRDTRTYFFATNPSHETAKVRFQAFRSTGQMVHESEISLPPGYSDTALKFSLNPETQSRPELFVMTSNKPVLAFGWTIRDEYYSQYNVNTDMSSAHAGIAMTELTPREIDCQTDFADNGWLCMQATSRTPWGETPRP